ncbi:hypothetical protein EMPG_17516 [Blastomyces silverae]|uniref:Uncharacterized protein n=1 Tax=Blastomyces silverae TaxID=2060906 RepID=A0A0H1B7C4_9EURO|nr:hypothetical protein EMPG_17516 [Blastomyces silverae]
MSSKNQSRRANTDRRDSLRCGKLALRVRRAMSALKIDVRWIKQKGIREGVIVPCLGCIRVVTFTADFAVACLTFCPITNVS